MRITLALALALALILMLAHSALAQQPAQTETPQPTAEPTLIFVRPTAVPQGIASAPQIGILLPKFLSGVGATPISAGVNIRLGPGLTYPRIGVLRMGQSIDVVGTNGYDQTRSCLGDFQATLDMWLQVRYIEQRGWIARCAVDVTGDTSRLLVQPPP